MKQLFLFFLFCSNLPVHAMGKYEFDTKIWKNEAEFSIYYHDYKHAKDLIVNGLCLSIRPHFLETLKRTNKNFSDHGMVEDKDIKAIIDHIAN
ncbi:hypothetical protein ACFLXW_00610 [Candidatus Dependentiae bacterium]